MMWALGGSTRLVDLLITWQKGDWLLLKRPWKLKPREKEGTMACSRNRKKTSTGRETDRPRTERALNARPRRMNFIRIPV